MNNETLNNNFNMRIVLSIASITFKILTLILMFCPVITVTFFGDISLFEFFLDEEVKMPGIIVLLVICAILVVVGGVVTVSFFLLKKGYKKSRLIFPFVADIITTAGIAFILIIMSYEGGDFYELNGIGILLVIATIISTIISAVLTFLPERAFVASYGSFRSDIPVQVPRRNVILDDDTKILSYLERGFIFLSNGEWYKASEYMEIVLDNDPKCVRAYLGLLMAEMHITDESELSNAEVSFENNKNYINAVRFADSETEDRLNGYLREFKDKYAQKVYAEAIMYMNSGDYSSALELFERIDGYKDVKEISNICREKVENANKIKERKKATVILSLITVIVVVIMVLAISIPLYFVPKVKLSKQMESFENASVGDVVKFGYFEGEDIEWIVLDIDDEEAVIITKDILARMNYDSAYDYICYGSEMYEKTFPPMWSKKIHDPLGPDLITSYVAEEYFKSNKSRACGQSYWMNSDYVEGDRMNTIAGDGSIVIEGTQKDVECGLRLINYINLD